MVTLLADEFDLNQVIGELLLLLPMIPDLREDLPPFLLSLHHLPLVLLLHLLGNPGKGQLLLGSLAHFCSLGASVCFLGGFLGLVDGVVLQLLLKGAVSRVLLGKLDDGRDSLQVFVVNFEVNVLNEAHRLTGHWVLAL